MIERAIANFKVLRCMHTDYRRPLRTYVTAFHTIRALHFFKPNLRPPSLGVSLLSRQDAELWTRNVDTKSLDI